MRYIVRLSYDGTNFYGYEKQPNKRCVESELERAVKKINNNIYSKVTASGRTDRGVHALDQVVSFTLDISITDYKLKRALNTFLPDDIHVFEVNRIDDDFHPRYMVKEKEYIYKINVGEYNPLDRNYVYQYNRELDIDKMNLAIKKYIGIHNFESFVSKNAKKDNYVREIYKVNIDKDEDIITISFTGNGFMKYQIRNMVGTLIKIGAGKLDVDIIDKIFEDKKYDKYVYTAKSEGLYLFKVNY